MKLTTVWLTLGSLVFGGCESISDTAAGVRERIAGWDQARTRTFSAAQRPTYEAVKMAAHQMGYRFVRGGAAQGEFEAISGVRPGETTGSARQLALKARLEPNLDGGTQVSVRFTEIIEASSSDRPGLATETPLRDTPQYEVFFRAVEQALEAKPM